MRFKVVDGSQSAHCCFDATVVDTTKPAWGANRYEAICECFERVDAEMIADALNASERLAEADKANQLLRAEIAAQSREEDLILTALRLDPERYRTECGYLNVPKIIAAIKHPDQYPRLADSADEVQR